MSLRIFSPSGWNKPVAKRFHLRWSSFSSMPLTIQTLPPMVLMAAVWPSEKKSKPVKRMKLWYGLLSGAVRVSTT